MRDYRCPTCGGEFNHHNGACPFCGIKMGLHPYHEMTLINRVALEKAIYRQSDRGTHPHKPEIKVELPPVSVIEAMGFGIDIEQLEKDVQDHVDTYLKAVNNAKPIRCTEYTIIATIDEHTCSHCESINGKTSTDPDYLVSLTKECEHNKTSKHLCDTCINEPYACDGKTKEEAEYPMGPDTVRECDKYERLERKCSTVVQLAHMTARPPDAHIRVMDSPYQAPAQPSLVTPPKPKPKSKERETEIKKETEKTKEVSKKK